MPTPGPLELVIILVIALLILGPGRLPDVGSALGKSLREFRKASSDIQDSVKVDTSPLPPDAPPAPPVVPPAPPVVPPVAPANPVTPAPVASEPAPSAAPPGEIASGPAPEASTKQPGSESTS
jgi:TatA/E family protein of Tat protein translocase